MRARQPVISADLALTAAPCYRPLLVFQALADFHPDIQSATQKI